jgi:glycosyltransferase involved in cell wall biosynthesis
VHFQWLSLQPLDLHLLPRPSANRRLVITAHDILPREAHLGQRKAQRRLYERFDAVVAHTEHGRERLIGELALDPRRVHLIPHGALAPWETHRDSGDSGAVHLGGPRRSDPASREELPAGFRDARGPVVLSFGLLRPYKGLEILVEAWRSVHGAELWIVGMPRMDTSSLHASATPTVRFLERFVSDFELYAFLRRASLVVLPYREIDASGAAFTAIAAGLPLLLSDAGGFPEIASTGCARIVPAGDTKALAQAIGELIADPPALEAMAARARTAAAGPYAWENIAAKTLSLYERLLVENRRS